MNKLPKRLRHLVKAANVPTFGYVYVVQCNEFVKIGIANNVASRIGEMQVGNPYEIVFLGAWKVQNPFKHEAAIHLALAEYAVRGEWFKLTKDWMDNISRKMTPFQMAQVVTPAQFFVEWETELKTLNPGDFRPACPPPLT